MFKTLHQNRFLHVGKPFFWFFNFDIEFIEGTQNSIPDFLTHEFLQSPNHNVGEKDTACPTPQTP